jgi:hypothetical protein
MRTLRRVTQDPAHFNGCRKATSSLEQRSRRKGEGSYLNTEEHSWGWRDWDSWTRGHSLALGRDILHKNWDGGNALGLQIVG